MKFKTGEMVKCALLNIEGTVVGYRQNGMLIIELDTSAELYETVEDYWE